MPETSKAAKEIKKKSKVISSKEYSLQIHKIDVKESMYDKETSLAKYSLGKSKKSQNVSDKVLMVVGATGAGKTTLINGMVNYIFNVNWEDNFRFKLITDESAQSQAHSQTSMISAYTIYPQEGLAIDFPLTIIDTPGFGDTRGIEQDKLITQQIQNFFSLEGQNGIDHLNGIGFVTQAALARLTPTQDYIINSILSIFGNDVAGNIFMMVTFADGQKPPVITAIEEAKIPFTHFFKFNNSALYATNETKAEESDEDGENFDAMFWRMGFVSFRKFFIEFTKKESVSLILTKEVLREREQLETTVQEMQNQINAGVSKLAELRQEEAILQQKKTQIESSKDFTYTIKVIKQEKVDLERGVYVTNCLQCNYTCHERCIYSDDRDKYMCSAMDNGGAASAKCRICPGTCSWKQHVNNPYYFRLYEDFEERTSDDLKKRFDIAMEGKSQTERMMAQINDYLAKVQATVMSMVDEVQRATFRLDEIALRPHPLNQVDHLNLLIESEKQQAKSGFQERIKFYEEAKEKALIVKTVKHGVDSFKDIPVNTKPSRLSAITGFVSRFKFW